MDTTRATSTVTSPPPRVSVERVERVERVARQDASVPAPMHGPLLPTVRAAAPSGADRPHPFGGKNLKSVSRFGGGNKGYVFLLKNKEGGKQVVKFQAEHPAEAMIGTHVMRRARGKTPRVTSASHDELSTLAEGVGELPGAQAEVGRSVSVSSATTQVPSSKPATALPTTPQLLPTSPPTATTSAGPTAGKRAMLAAMRDKGAHKQPEQDLPAAREHFLQLAQRQGDHKHALMMDFAKGQTIKKMMETDPAGFVRALKHTRFQRSFGRILAGDTFSGNPDRAMAVLSQGTPTGWYHEENMFIHGAGKKAKAVAIDNAFKPGMAEGVSPYGVNARGAQIAGATAGSPKILKEHADLVFTRMIKQLNTLGTAPVGKADTAEHQRFREAAVAAEQHRKKFVDNVVGSGTRAMGRLLERGQGWKGQFAAMGATPEDLGRHRMRTRYLRMLGAGVEPDEAEQLMSDQRQYREWVLHQEKETDPAAAAKIVAQGDEAYKAAKFA